MLEMQIAGKTIAYRNIGDLQEKLVALLDKAHRRRVTAEGSYRAARKEEESLLRLLGGCPPAEETAGLMPGSGSTEG